MSRIEDMLQGIIDGADPSELPAPQSRIEGILEGILEGTDVSDMPAPQSRVEALLLGVLDKINKGGGGGGGSEIESGIYEPSSDINAPVISFANEHSEPPMFAMIIDTNGSTTADYTWLGAVVTSFKALTGSTVQTSASSVVEASRLMLYRGYRGAYVGANSFLIETDSTIKNKPSTYLSKTSFSPAYSGDSNTSSVMWRKGRSYKWVAVWAPEE